MNHPLCNFHNLINISTYPYTKPWRVYGGCSYGPPFGWTFVLFSAAPSTSNGIYFPIFNPGCKLWINPRFVFSIRGPFQLDSYGHYESSSIPYLTIPRSSTFCGAQFYTQFIATDTSGNMYSSNGKFFQLPLWNSNSGVNLGIGQVFKYGLGAAKATWGYAHGRNNGIITKFH